MLMKPIGLIPYFLLSVFIASEAMAENSFKAMPPTFSINNDPGEVLRTYPLGTITEVEAFSHHGPAIRKITLPNGNEGWIYKIGEKLHVPNVYVLEFSKDGRVIDVLHKDHRFSLGHSALQYQYLANTLVDKQILGPGPGE